MPESERQAYWKLGAQLGVTGPMFLVLAARNVLLRGLDVHLLAPLVPDKRDGDE